MTFEAAHCICCQADAVRKFIKYFHSLTADNHKRVSLCCVWIPCTLHHMEQRRKHLDQFTIYEELVTEGGVTFFTIHEIHYAVGDALQ